MSQAGKFGRKAVKGFLHAEGTKIVNGDNEEIILEGYGVGNWVNPEGFMCGSPRVMANGGGGGGNELFYGKTVNAFSISGDVLSAIVPSLLLYVNCAERNT